MTYRELCARNLSVALRETENALLAARAIVMTEEEYAAREEAIEHMKDSLVKLESARILISPNI